MKMHQTRFTTTLLFLLFVSLASVSCSPVETIDYANGDVYVGEHRDDQRNGQGTHTYANGDVYIGEHRDGLSNGQGTYTFADGRVSSGIWRDNELITENDN